MQAGHASVPLMSRWQGVHVFTLLFEGGVHPITQSPHLLLHPYKTKQHQHGQWEKKSHLVTKRHVRANLEKETNCCDLEYKDCYNTGLTLSNYTRRGFGADISALSGIGYDIFPHFICFKYSPWPAQLLIEGKHMQVS